MGGGSGNPFPTPFPESILDPLMFGMVYSSLDGCMFVDWLVVGRCRQVECGWEGRGPWPRRKASECVRQEKRERDRG